MGGNTVMRGATTNVNGEVRKTEEGLWVALADAVPISSSGELLRINGVGLGSAQLTRAAFRLNTKVPHPFH